MRQFITRFTLFFIFSFALAFTAAANDSDIVNCNHPWKIVVLGSSTAYGTGATTYDSSWVGKFTAYVKRRSSQNEIYNLGIPGYTTYQNLCPTGLTPPANRPSPNSSFNITAALALHPDAIIINMPSNDAANDYTIAEQQANFLRTIRLADSANVPVWVTTTQPRNNMNATQISNLTTMRDWIFTRFGDKAVDVWSGIANADGSISNYYDYDYVHVNNFGHDLFYKRITAETILDSLCARVTQTLFAKAGSDLSLNLPVSNVTLNGSASYSTLGGVVTNYQWTKVSGPDGVQLSAPNNAVTNITGLAEGRYAFLLTVTDNASNVKSDTVNIVVSSRILIDFGPDITATPDVNGNYWNTVTDGQAGVKITGAVTTGNIATNIGLQVINRIDGTFNVSGPGTNTGNSLGSLNDYPSTATSDFAFAEPSATNGQWKMTGLESTKQYTIKFWGTRTVGDDRIIQIKRADQSTWQEYNATGNSSYSNAAIFTFSGKTSMSFDIRVKSGSPFGYICLVDISRTAPAQAVNVVPYARANDVTVALPATTGTLDGSASGDDDGVITSYQWIQTSGPSTATIVSPSAAITALNDLGEGIYTFRLTVTDDSSAVAFTDITVTVNTRILIDFGGTLTSGADAGGKYWNNVADASVGVKIADAVNTGNATTGLAFEIVNRIDGTFNTAGPGTNSGSISATVGDYPVSAVADYAFAHNSATNGNWKITGLDSTKQYTIKFWGTRDASDERSIQIKPSDATQWQEYDARNNTDYNNAAVFTFKGKTERSFDIKVKDNSTFSHISLIDIKVTNPPVDCSPSISITTDQVAAICAGTAINFTAVVTNGGTQPVYVWKKNNVVIGGANAAIYTATDLTNNDSISCTVTANTNCYYGIEATSNVVAASVIPTVVLGAISGPTDVCPLIGGVNATLYSVSPVANATTYNWTVPTGASIVSGQGSNSIAVSFTSNFGSTGDISVVGGSCINDVRSNLALVKNSPATPGTISGPVSACPYLGTTTQVTYSITAVQYATSYTWTVPANVTIVSGQGTTSIKVTFGSAFSTSLISVKAVSNCFTSKDAALSISAAATETPGVISGPTEACTYIGTTAAATYTIRKVPAAASYSWTVPTGATITTHPAGTGVNDTAITVTYNSNFVSGTSITVKAIGCTTSAASILTISKTAPATPGVIAGPTDICSYIGVQATYTIRKVTGANSYTWTVPAGGTVAAHTAGVNDTIIKVTFTSSLVSGTAITVKANACLSSAASSLTLLKVAPATPGAITGPTEACAYIGTSTTATYSIRKVTGATSYTWTAPTGVTIATHTAGINDTTIKVTFSSSFVGGTTIKVTANSCASSASASIAIGRPIPAAPAPITILVAPCKYLLNSPAGAFSVPKVAGLTYNWSAPLGSSIYHMGSTTGTADTIGIYFSILFNGGTVSVTASNGCGTSAATSVSVGVIVPATLSLNLSGPSDPCPYIGSTTGAVYKVSKVEGVPTYTWTVPTTGVTVAHPGGTGENDTIIVVNFTSSFTSGSITVKANTACGSSAVKTITLAKTTPSIPGTITATSIAACPNRRYTYSVSTLPTNATSINWTVPAGATIVSGQGTTSITVSYPSTAVSGTVSAYGRNNCNTSSAKTITVSLAKCATAARGTDVPETITSKEVLPAGLEITVMPNPTYTEFKFIVKSNDKQTPVSLRIVDISGKVSAVKTGITPGQMISIGGDLKQGVYMGEFIQGEKRTVVKLVKL